jgi:hypothetical protein
LVVRENRTVIEELLTRSTEDWVFDDHICDAVLEHSDVSDWESLRAMAFGIALELLTNGYVYPVLWDESPWAQERTVPAYWDGNPRPGIDKLRKGWAAKTEPDGFSDIVWFGPFDRWSEQRTVRLPSTGPAMRPAR